MTEPTKTTRYCLRDLYDALRCWKADRAGLDHWTLRDDELYFVMTVLLAPPKGATLDTRFAIDSYPLTEDVKAQLPPSGEPTHVEWRPDAIVPSDD